MELIGTKYAFTPETAAALCQKPHNCRRNRWWPTWLRWLFFSGCWIDSTTNDALQRVKKGTASLCDKLRVKLFGIRLYKITAPYQPYDESNHVANTRTIEGDDERCALGSLVAHTIEYTTQRHLTQFGHHKYREDCPGCMEMWDKWAKWLNACSIERVF